MKQKDKWYTINKLPRTPRTPYHPYLVWLKGENGPIECGIAKTTLFSRDTKQFFPIEGWTELIITHWMPLPKPPKQKG